LLCGCVLGTSSTFEYDSLHLFFFTATATTTTVILTVINNYTTAATPTATAGKEKTGRHGR
jgi:hypothetical protein